MTRTFRSCRRVDRAFLRRVNVPERGRRSGRIPEVAFVVLRWQTVDRKNVAARDSDDGAAAPADDAYLLQVGGRSPPSRSS